MEEREQYFGGLTADLETIQRCCRNCEAILLRYKNREEPVAGSSAGAASAERRETPGVTPHHAAAAHPAAIEPARILVVDDSAETCGLLTKFLTRERHVVQTAHDGRTALELLNNSDFDLVLLDFMMPGLTGFEVLQRIKDDERLRHTPVIMISALDSVDDMVPCIERGADDYLTKPVDFALLKARVSASLERMRLREREYGQYFGPELARQILRNPQLIQEARQADVTVLFCDIRGFSRISEQLDPSLTVRWLSDVMAELTACVRRQHGVPVNYIGDELVAMWGAPEERNDHAQLACRAAFEMLGRRAKISDRWQGVIGDATDFGIGINSGIAQVGNTGSSVKVVYGPLGNTVNLASRMQGATKYLGAQLLVTGNTQRRLNGEFASRKLCQVRAKNIQEPIELYELLTPDRQPARLVERYEAALTHFEGQQMPQAAAMLSQLLVEHPQDGPALLLMSRVVDRLLRREEAFSPVWDLPGK
jgi:adenylate cyclase